MSLPNSAALLRQDFWEASRIQSVVLRLRVTVAEMADRVPEVRAGLATWIAWLAPPKTREWEVPGSLHFSQGARAGATQARRSVSGTATGLRSRRICHGPTRLSTQELFHLRRGQSRPRYPVGLNWTRAYPWFVSWKTMVGRCSVRGDGSGRVITVAESWSP
jgi:hypothetical protein